MMDSHRDEIAKLESLYASNPEGRVFTHLAEACRKAGQLERAREILEEGLRRHPDYASAHVVLGRVLSDSGNAAAAADEFRRVLELDRHNLVALRSLGDLARDENRVDEALYYYGELAVLDPTDGGIQEEIRRLRVQLAEGPSAAPVAAAPAEPAQPMAESVPPAAPESGTASAVEPQVTAGEPAALPEPTLAEATPAPADAWPGGWPTPEAEQLPRELAMELPQEETAPAEPVPGMPDLAGLTLESAPGQQLHGVEAAADELAPEWPAAAGTPEIAGLPEPEATDSRSMETPAAGVGGGAAEKHWTDSQSSWPQPPAQKDAERRADLGDSGEWIPAERWEWMAASADPETTGAASSASDSEREPAEAAWSDEPVEAEPESPGWIAAEQAWQEQPKIESEGYETEIHEIEGFESGEVAEYIETFESTEYHLTVTPLSDTQESVSGDYADDEGDLVITETLAEIYASQGLYERAAAVYRRLLDRRPDDERLIARLEELESSPGWPPSEPEREVAESSSSESWLERVESVWTGGEGAVSGEESPYAWPAESAEETAGRPVGDYFRSLLSWRPGLGEPGAEPSTQPSALAGEPGTVDADPATSFDAWFSRESTLPDDAARGETGRGSTGAEADEDLEMFRSWLKSLKK